MKWRARINSRSGSVVPNCWETDSGHTVAVCLIETKKVYVVTRAGSRKPDSYCSDRNEVIHVLRGFNADQV